MAKKHWIYIKRGLSEDPKHRAQMGECIWLYMHIIDRADWETGIAFNWKDKDEASEMSMPVDTLRRQRQKLEEMDYIRCAQKQHSQDIYIMEWKNPRDYGAETKNPRSEGSHKRPPSTSQGSNQGLNQGSNQVQAQVRTPTYSSESSSSSIQEEEGRPNLFGLYTQEIGLITPMIADSIQDWEKDLPEQWIRDAIAEAVKSNVRSWRYIEAILKRWHAQGNQEPVKKPTRSNSHKSKAEPPARPELTEEELEAQRAMVRQALLGGTR